MATLNLKSPGRSITRSLARSCRFHRVFSIPYGTSDQASLTGCTGTDRNSNTIEFSVPVQRRPVQPRKITRLMISLSIFGAAKRLTYARAIELKQKRRQNDAIHGDCESFQRV